MNRSRLFVYGLLAMLVVCVGTILTRETEAALSERDAAHAQLDASARLDSLQRAKAARLTAERDSAAVKYSADLALLRRRLASTRPTIDSIIVEATVTKTDTVLVPVTVLADAAETLKGCNLFAISCENRISAEQNMRVFAEEEALKAKADRDAAVQLIPTARQRVVQNAKVAAVTVGFLAVVRGIVRAVDR